MALKIVFVLMAVCAAYASAGYLAAPAVSYAAPAVTYAAPAVTYAAAPVLIDNTHFSYGYLNPFGNGHVNAARHGPIASHSYTFRAGTAY